MSSEAGEIVVGVSNSLLLGVSSRFKLFAYGTTAVLGGLRVKVSHTDERSDRQFLAKILYLPMNRRWKARVY